MTLVCPQYDPLFFPLLKALELRSGLAGSLTGHDHRTEASGLQPCRALGIRDYGFRFSSFWLFAGLGFGVQGLECRA